MNGRVEDQPAGVPLRGAGQMAMDVGRARLQMARRYYLCMSSLAVVGFLWGALQAFVGSHTHHQLSMASGMAVAMGFANFVCAWVLFVPVRRFLHDGSTAKAVRERLIALPWISSAWTFLVAASIMTAPFLVEFVEGGGARPGHTFFVLGYQSLLMSIHAVFMGLLMYFLVDDYTGWLKAELFRLHGMEIPVGQGSVLTKLVVAFLATAAIPLLLVFFDAVFISHIEELQGYDMREAFLLDLIAAVSMAFVAIIFIRRSLLRPIGMLLASVRRLDQGDLETRTPVVSDDEIGVLTERFNGMVIQLRDREFLRETFGRYVPKRIADAILENRGALKPQKRDATILFTDIQDFTRIVEGLAPEQLVITLNEYFSSLVEIVERHGGVVTQFQGDALLVSFNVPLEDAAHAANAVRAAQEIEQLTSHRRFGDGVEFITRVGINSGVVIAGPVGAENRLIYTVHGDAVNLAARLEALNKDHGTRILVAESTRVLAGQAFRFRPLGEIAVRGKSEPVSVFTLM